MAITKLNILDNGINRSLTVDIIKGLLIICVIIGHAYKSTDVRYIYWFHMPAFFIVSGFFLKSNPNKEEVKKKIIRLVIPYITFSIVLGVLARHGNIGRTLFCSFYGGCKNLTAYTGPYYFINALFVAIILYYLGEKIIARNKVLSIHDNLSMFIYCISLYIFAHIVDNILPIGYYKLVPWAVDDALFVVIFLYIGKFGYSTMLRLRGGIKFMSIALCILIIALDSTGVLHYDFDLKYHKWMFGIDLLVPTIFITGLFAISDLLSKVTIINNFFAFLGQACMILFYMHQFFLHTLREQIGMTNTCIVIVLSVAFSSIIYISLINPKLTSSMFLGKEVN